jgi:hypothetical protein
MLKKIWDSLFHNHKWEQVSGGVLNNDYGRPVGHYFHLRCKTCGTMKMQKFYG